MAYDALGAERYGFALHVEQKDIEGPPGSDFAGQIVHSKFLEHWEQLRTDLAEIKARPAGVVTLTDADRADIAVRVAAEIGGKIDTLIKAERAGAQAEAAALTDTAG